jgi:hypothetical protein
VGKAGLNDESHESPRSNAMGESRSVPAGRYSPNRTTGRLESSPRGPTHDPFPPPTQSGGTNCPDTPERCPDQIGIGVRMPPEYAATPSPAATPRKAPSTPGAPRTASPTTPGSGRWQRIQRRHPKLKRGEAVRVEDLARVQFWPRMVLHALCAAARARALISPGV